jgi:hypothetical protein
MDGNTISYNGAGTHDMYYYSQSMETLNTEKKKNIIKNKMAYFITVHH